MLIISFLLTITLIGLFVAIKSFEKQQKAEKRLNSFVPLDSESQENRQFQSVSKKKSTGVLSKLRDYYRKTLSLQQEEEIQKKILQAGTPFNITVADYYIINNIIKITIPLLMVGYANLLGANIIVIMLFAALGFLLAFKALDFYINLKIKSRYKKALRELPDFLDLITISVEAGLGFDLALNKIIARKKGVLSSEFFMYLEEIRLGKAKKEALTGIKERLAFEEMRSFINSIIQSEKLGVNLVQTLRVKSEDERDRRRQRAEEEAMKTSIKILFPLLFFIFPSIFIIVFGPVFIQIISAFSKVK